MAEAGVSPHRKLRVLIADDIQETRRNTRLMLSMISDVEVVAIASDGLQAVDMTKEKQPDVVILDINMPEMNGLDAFKKIKQIRPDIECIIITALKESDLIREAMSIGIREYLYKPFTVDQLEQSVEKVSKRIWKKLQKTTKKKELLEQNESYIKQLANEYAKSKRTDDQAMEVFEQLAANPACEIHWLRVLAMAYVIRQDWGKLKNLAKRLQQQTN